MTDRLRRFVSERTRTTVLSVVLAALCLALVAQLIVRRDPPALRISAGPEGTRRHSVVEYLRDQAAEHRLRIELSPNAGTEDCLNQIKSGQLDAAVVSNGLLVPKDDDVRVVAALQLEHVHVLVRRELQGETLAHIVRGRRVNLGEPDSTEWHLSRDLLAFGRLRLPSGSRPGDVLLTELGKHELIERAQAILRAEGPAKDALIAELPDCLLVLATMPSTVVQLLVEAADYRVVPLPVKQAYLMNNMQDSHAGHATILREFLQPAVIPAGSYFADEAFPEVDCPTIAVRLLVVVRRDLPARAVRPLMQSIFEGEFSRRILPLSPRELASPYAIHPAAVAYLDRDKPIGFEVIADWLSNSLSIFGAFSAGALSLYGLLKARKTRRPSDYFTEIRQIDQFARGTAAPDAAGIEPDEISRHLEERLHAVRQNLIQDICEGRIKGDQVIANILALINDTRRHLPRPVEASNSRSVLSWQKPADRNAA